MDTQIRSEVERIRNDIRRGSFVNEAAVCNGVVLPLLHSLGWPVFNPQVVAPEYATEGKRVDYALCHPARRPRVFVEVKQLGRSEGADRQLFEYAFHQGVPMAVLTDGQEWHFYLPAEQGHYQERRVYKLDLVERELEECVRRFKRYLTYDLVASGQAIENARADYQSVRRQREAEETLPSAWRELVQESSDVLVELLADQVENLCGYKPEPEVVIRFLTERVAIVGEQPVARSSMAQPPRQRADPPVPPTIRPQPQPTKSTGGLERTGFELHGHFQSARNGRAVMIQVFQELDRADPTFLERFAALPKHGKRRRFVARDRGELYPERPDLARDHSFELRPGWWIGTNYGVQQMTAILQRAAEVAGVVFDRDLRVKLD